MIPDEAVEAAAAELYNREGYTILFADARTYVRARFREAARAALEAALPYLTGPVLPQPPTDWPDIPRSRK